jgi:hypothetical protein
MGTWGVAERLVQPTDQESGRFSCSPRDARAVKEERAWLRIAPSRAGRFTQMKARFMRIAMTLTSVGLIALAGGASLKGF